MFGHLHLKKQDSIGE